MSALVAAAPRSLHPSLLRIWLVGVAMLEVWSTLSDLPAGFLEPEAGSPANVVTLLTRADLLIAPFFAVAALIFAIGREVRLSILASSLLTLIGWATDFPTILARGFEITPDLAGLDTFAARIAAPLAAAIAILLLWQTSRPPVIAAVLAGLPVIAACLALARVLG